MWFPLEKQNHINGLELLAVYFGLKSFLFLLKGKHVCIKSDYCLLSQCNGGEGGGTKSPVQQTCQKCLPMAVLAVIAK